MRILKQEPKHEELGINNPTTDYEFGYNNGCDDTEKYFESCLVDVDIDEMYRNYRDYIKKNDYGHITPKLPKFSAYFKEQIGG